MPKPVINYRYTNAINGGFGVLGKGIHNALISNGYQISDKADINLFYGMPNLLDDTNGLPTIYYTVWESSKYPGEWAEKINKSKVDLVLTASEFTKKSLLNAGVKCPVEVWHHGIDERWKYKRRRDDGVFTFIHYNAYEWRKGWELVLGAFMQEFDESEPVQLILKARELSEGLWLREINRGEDDLNIKNVKELLGHLSDEEMVDFLERADCGVFPVKGEGWFLPATECVAQGISVIMPNQMAMAEQWNTACIDLEIEGWFKSEPRYPGAMIMPSLEDLKRKMRWAYEHENLLRENGKIGSREVYERFNWGKVIADLSRYIKLYFNK